MSSTAVAQHRMRILHVLHSHGYGGAENHALVLMQALQAQGHEVHCAGSPGSWLAQRCAQAGIPFHGVAMRGLYDVFSMLKLRRLVARWRPHVVHGHLIRGAFYAGLAAWGRPGAVAICTAHATTARKHMERCRHVIAVSAAVRQALLQHGQTEDRVTLVYNGVPDVPTEDRQALRDELGMAPATFALVNAGRFVADKGQDTLVRALKHCGPDVHLYLIGDAQTPFGESVRASVPEHVRVTFLGYRADVPRLLGAFDAYVLGSRREALGLSLVEAAAARLPSIATSVGGVPEVVLDGRSGWLVPVDDVLAMAQQVERLRAQEPQARAAMGELARQHYLAHFMVQRMVEGTVAVYRRVAAGVA